MGGARETVYRARADDGLFLRSNGVHASARAAQLLPHDVEIALAAAADDPDRRIAQSTGCDSIAPGGRVSLELMGTPLPLRDLQMFIHEAGAGPALVFIHGLGWDHRLWLASLARYERGFRVILGDTRGHGQSD